MDKDGNGFILLKEFWDVMVVFAKGTPQSRAQFIFDIYDVTRNNALGEDDLKAVITSESTNCISYHPLKGPRREIL